MDATPRRRVGKRFSTRAMLTAVVLIAMYLACWGPTQTWGHRQVEAILMERDGLSRVSVEAIAPLVYRQRASGPPQSDPTGARWIPVDERYYLWWCGFVARLPVTTTSVVAVDPKIRQ